MDINAKLDLPMIEISQLNQDSFRDLLLYLTDSGSSDAYIKSGYQISFKKNDQKCYVTNRVILENELSALISEIKDRVQTVNMETGGKLNCDYRIKRSDKSIANYRINGGSYGGNRGLILTIRAVNTVPLDINQTKMPEEIVRAHLSGRKGIGFFTGDTGSGKSTSQGALIVETMRKKYSHIITLENPIEQIYEGIDGALTDCVQYQKDRDFDSWETGINSALRENPDYILVGEARSPQTINAALMAAETGHSVSTTIHVSRGFGLFSRIVSSFEASLQNDVKARLAELLNYVVFQKIVVGTDGKRFAIREYLVLDKEGRAELQSCKFQDVTKVMYDLFEKKGRLIHKDIVESYQQDLISEFTYKSLLAKYEVSDEDLVGVAA